MKIVDPADQLAIRLILTAAFFFGDRVVRDVPGFPIVMVSQRVFDSDGRRFRLLIRLHQEFVFRDAGKRVLLGRGRIVDGRRFLVGMRMALNIKFQRTVRQLA